MTHESPSHARTVIRLSNPEELLASLPQLLGFRPADSLVLIADVEAGSSAVGPVMRCDVPAAPDRCAVAHQLVEAITRSTPSSVIIIVVGGCDPTDPDGIRDVPQRELIRAVRDELGDWGVEQPAALWVPEIMGGVGWRCYDHAQCGGLLPEPESTVAAATAVDLGIVTFGSREEVRTLVEPDDDEYARARTQRVGTHVRARTTNDGDEYSLERGLSVVRDTLGERHQGCAELSDDQLAELAVALSDLRVRDACLSTALPVNSVTARVASVLWQELTRVLPEPERAQAACLAGYAAYVRGDGALAGIALDIALRAEPTHVLAALLIRALQGGIHPRSIRQLSYSSEYTLWPASGPASEGANNGSI